MFHTVVQQGFKEIARNIIFILQILYCCFQSERIFQIGLQLMKLSQNVRHHIFLRLSVLCSQPTAKGFDIAVFFARVQSSASFSGLGLCRTSFLMLEYSVKFTAGSIIFLSEVFFLLSVCNFGVLSSFLQSRYQFHCSTFTVF